MTKFNSVSASVTPIAILLAVVQQSGAPTSGWADILYALLGVLVVAVGAFVWFWRKAARMRSK